MSVGELAAQCVGPHKVAFCELFDHRDGTYSLHIKPQEHGRHVLNIKYGGRHRVNDTVWPHLDELSMGHHRRFRSNPKSVIPGFHIKGLCLCFFFFLGEPVSGSPFSLRVMGAPDATKVRVHGPGIEHGVLATFQSRFLCDTRGAGAGQLTVRVRGPKGKADYPFKKCVEYCTIDLY